MECFPDENNYISENYVIDDKYLEDKKSLWF